MVLNLYVYISVWHNMQVDTRIKPQQNTHDRNGSDLNVIVNHVNKIMLRIKYHKSTQKVRSMYMKGGYERNKIGTPQIKPQ